MTDTLRICTLQTGVSFESVFPRKLEYQQHIHKYGTSINKKNTENLKTNNTGGARLPRRILCSFLQVPLVLNFIKIRPAFLKFKRVEGDRHDGFLLCTLYNEIPPLTTIPFADQMKLGPKFPEENINSNYYVSIISFRTTFRTVETKWWLLPTAVFGGNQNSTYFNPPSIFYSVHIPNYFTFST